MGAGGQHIFQNHLLPKQSHSLSLHGNEELIWPSLFLIFCLLLLVIIKMRALSKVIRIIQSTFSKQLLQQMEREEFNPFKLSSVILNLFFILNLSFLIYKINSIYKFVLIEKVSLVQFFFFLALIILISSLKVITNFALSLLTGERKIITEYSINSSLINQTFGLFIFPWIILAEFSKFNPLIFVCGAIIVLTLAILIKWYRGVIMGLVQERIGLLQIFSYFCGLEILPIFVIVKFIIETF